VQSFPTETAQQVIEALGLIENPHGGWFRQVQRVPQPAGVGRDGRDGRPIMTVINYLLDEHKPIAALHRMSADAVHFFHQGSPLAILTISPDGELDEVLLGPDADEGHVLQHVVPGGSWKAFEVRGPWALISEAVAPGWDAADEQVASPALYEQDHPELRARIEQFVR